MRKAIQISSALLLAVALTTKPLAAEPASEAWQIIAKSDVAAALDLIERTHPGAAAELGDLTFQSKLASAKAHAVERLPEVRSYQGYAAVMEGLAADFDDGHIRSSALVGAQRINNAGMLLTRQSGRWVVGVHDTKPQEQNLMGATLLGCDGQDVDRWAYPRISAFRGDPQFEGTLIKAAGWLFQDYGNPFLIRPTACRFRLVTGTIVDVALNWRAAFAPALRGSLQVPMRSGSAGITVEPFSDGWRIGVSSFDSTAETVANKVRLNLAALRATPLVVLDLRGNGGGDSTYGDMIVRLLVGDKRVAAARPSVPDCSGSFWRVSRNAFDMLLEARDAVSQQSGDMSRYYQSVAEDMRRALASNHRFVPMLPKCVARRQPAETERSARRLPPSLMKGRLVFITDRACFSSCLITTDLLRRLGALHVGETTDRSTRYMDVQEVALPSGLRTFTTLTKVAVGLSGFGPYVPTYAYPGNMADDSLVLDWVVEQSHKD